MHIVPALYDMCFKVLYHNRWLSVSTQDKYVYQSYPHWREQSGHTPLKHIPARKNMSMMKDFSETLHIYFAQHFPCIPCIYRLFAINLIVNSIVDRRHNMHANLAISSELCIQPTDDIFFFYYVITVSGMQEELQTFCISKTHL